MDARARELERIQSIGRVAAGAETCAELFVAVARALLGHEPLDLVGVVHGIDGPPELALIPARPLRDESVGVLARRASALLGDTDPAELAVEIHRVDPFDAARGAGPGPSDEDLVVVPLRRGSATVAWLLALPEPDVPENRLRLLYSAANQISVHLERILTAREREEDRFRAILESMPQAVLLVDRRANVIQSNGSARQLMEAFDLPDDGCGAAFFARLGLTEKLSQVGGGARDHAAEEVRVEGERVFDVTVTPLSGSRTPDRTVLVVLNDVTERRRLQQRLAHSEKMSSLGQMISGVTHELNNPLSTILGFTQMLGATATDEKLARRMGILHDEALRCQRIVQNLLSFARRRDPERTPLSVNEVVRSVASLMRYQLKVDNVALTTELSDDLPAVLGDRHQLQQVLVNLVTNAKHAIQSHGRGGAIAMRSAPRDDGAVLLEVIDDGPGVPDDIRSRIFDPFFTTKADGHGTGLGLSLVYGIVTAHDGAIDVVRAASGGANFRIMLPAHAGAQRGSTPDECVAIPAGSPRARILVVDDEPTFAGLLCEALASDGHLAESAADGAEALDRLRAQRFDLVVSDLKMPGVDGRALRDAIERMRPAPALLLTTGDTMNRETDELERQLGVTILRKPFELTELRRRVGESLARSEGD
jgi:two-component system NtrC family sensor kinase